MFLSLAYAQSHPSGGEPTAVLGTLLVVLLVYFVPTMIAGGRSHYNRSAIGALNLLLGWTVIGWVAALVWAFTNPSAAHPQASAIPAPPAADEPLSARLSKLEALKAEGLISEAEYDTKRAAILDEI